MDKDTGGAGAMETGDGAGESAPGADGQDRSTQARSAASLARDALADRRDGVAEARDEAAATRDRLAAELDVSMDKRDADHAADDGDASLGFGGFRRLAEERRRAAAARAGAARLRQAAARDRADAAEDRKLAARDRRLAAAELALEGTDDLTGALRRRVGLAAIQRELDRTARSHEPFTLVFVDVNGLKTVNDRDGHLAGDEVLRTVVHHITQRLRSYDLITRFGGDEFVIALSGQDAAGARARFDAIAEGLRDSATRPTFSVGFAQREGTESLTAMIARADGAVLRTRRAPPAG